MGETIETPPYRLYSIGQIVLASFLGSPFPGMWMISRNLRLLERPVEARKCLVWAFGLTLSCLVLAFTLPEHIPGTAVALPFLIGVRAFAQRWLASAIEDHKITGGQIASWWSAVGIGICGMIGFMLLIVAVVFMLPAE